MQSILQHNPAVPTCSAAESHAWQQLRQRYYEEDRDLWTERELAHLRFLRWLAQTGRLVEDGGPTADGAGADGR
jgi:hypothetical protein